MDLSRKELLSQLREVDGHDFEELIADVWEQQGWESTVTSGSGDDGIDVIIKKSDIIDKKYVIQAKCYAESNKIGSPDIRDLIGGIDLEGNVDGGIFVTTSSYTSEAKEKAERSNIRRINGEDLCNTILELDSQEFLSNYFKIVPDSSEKDSATDSTTIVSDSDISADSTVTDTDKSKSDTYWRDDKYEDILSDSSTTSKPSTESTANSSTTSKPSTESTANSSTTSKPSIESTAKSSTSTKTPKCEGTDEEYYEYAQEVEGYEYSTPSSKSTTPTTSVDSTSDDITPSKSTTPTTSVDSTSDDTTPSKSTTEKTHPFDEESVVAEPTKDHDYFSRCQVCGESDSIWYAVVDDSKTELLKCNNCGANWEGTQNSGGPNDWTLHKGYKCPVCDSWGAYWKNEHPVECDNCGTIWEEISNLIRKNRWKAKGGPQNGESKTKQQWQNMTEE